ncbi:MULTISPECIES: hypothetical protein [Nocardia]|uniref:hypothetical protein n=1 Tax=Nocardia TaxID=1817 RepID=UPI0011094E5A|nr:MULTISPECIES: hypothetical protein [Nocardia]
MSNADREPSLMYGYLRKELLGDHQSDVEHRLRDLAGLNGFNIAALFCETGAGTGALWQLMRAIESTGARDVAVPSEAHLTAGRSQQRTKFLHDLDAVDGLRVWCLDLSNRSVVLSGFRRSVVLPRERTLARLLLRTGSVTVVEEARMDILNTLSRARLRHMVDDVEHFVLSALSDFIPADSGGNPPIFADLTATLPNLTESIVLTVWLLLRGPALEVQVLRSPMLSLEPIGPDVLGPAAAGRRSLRGGARISWIRLPIEPGQSPLAAGRAS